MRLKLVKSDVLDDWYLIERAEHDGREWMEPFPEGGGASFMRSARIGNADVEGPLAEMRQLAAAIRARDSYEARRCAVTVHGEVVALWSPRNSIEATEVTVAEADDLATQIEALAAQRREGGEG